LLLSEFKKKVKDKKIKIGIVGLGYVGLPLAMAFVKNGFQVTGIDVDKRKAARLNAGDSYILDVPSPQLADALKRKLFRAHDNYKALPSLDAVIICVPTPLGKTKEPDISSVVNATQAIARYLRKGQLVVLESTTYPGTTEEVMLPLLEKNGLRAERDFFLAFSPERVDPGNKVFNTMTIPKVVGGIGARSGEAAKALYGAVIRKIVQVSTSKTAEMVKLLENTFRSVNIGLINEIALMSHRLDVDIWEVIEAARSKPFGFMPFYPGPGLGGHCLPIDPLYLSWKSRLHGFDSKMIDLASSINERMPLFVVERVASLLNTQRVTLKNAPILVLGVAYKRNTDDVRESPALEVIEHLIEQGSQVVYSDPLVPSVRIKDKVWRSKRLDAALVARQKCVVVLTDHAALDYELVVRHARLILDTRNALRKFHPRKNIFFL